MTLLLPLLLAATPDAGVLLSKPMEVSAKKLEVFQAEKRAVYTGNAKAVRATTTLTCDRIEVFFSTANDIDRIVATGNVEAVDGERWAQGDSATYHTATGVLVVEGNPKARQGQRHIAGEQVSFTTGTDTLVVTKAKTLTQQSSVKGASVPVDIVADALTLKNAERTAIWAGHVVVHRGPTTLTAPEMVAHYDERGEVTRMVGRGGVEAIEPNRWARGQQATYDALLGVLVVTGRPTARQGTTRMRGTKVTMRTGTDLVEVENAVTLIQAEKRAKK